MPLPGNSLFNNFAVCHFRMSSFCVLNSAVCHFLFGGHKAVVRPDPIPNSAVKHSLADGSGCIASARVGCRQFFPKAEMLHRVSAFLLGKAVVSTNFSR